jgi:hypothetical protein
MTTTSHSMVLNELPTTVLVPPAAFVGQPSIFCGTPVNILREMTGQMTIPFQRVLDGILTYMEELGIEITMPTVAEEGEDMCAAKLLSTMLVCGALKAAPNA